MKLSIQEKRFFFFRDFMCEIFELTKDKTERDLYFKVYKKWSESGELDKFLESSPVLFARSEYGNWNTLVAPGHEYYDQVREAFGDSEEPVFLETVGLHIGEILAESNGRYLVRFD